MQTEFKQKMSTLANLVQGHLQDFDENSFKIVLSNTATVFAWYDGYNNKGKIKFSLIWPKDIDNKCKSCESWSWSLHSDHREAMNALNGLRINCSMSKSVDALYSDLVKRLHLDSFKRMYGLCLDHNIKQQGVLYSANESQSKVFDALQHEGFEPRVYNEGIHKTRIYIKDLPTITVNKHSDISYDFEIRLNQNNMLSFINWAKENIQPERDV